MADLKSTTIYGDLTVNNRTYSLTSISVGKQSANAALDISGSVLVSGSNVILGDGVAAQNAYYIANSPVASECGITFQKAGVTRWLNYIAVSGTDLRWNVGGDKMTLTSGGNLFASGPVTSSNCFLVDTNTSFSALAATSVKILAQSAWGGVLSGYGTTNDVSIFNRAGSLALSVPANTVNVSGAGHVSGSALHASGNTSTFLGMMRATVDQNAVEAAGFTNINANGAGIFSKVYSTAVGQHGLWVMVNTNDTALWVGANNAVGIGKTGPNAKLDVLGNTTISGSVFITSSLGVGTSTAGAVGEIRATNNVTAYYSDERLKTILGNIPNALAKVMTLSGFYFEANETAQKLGYEKKKEVGVSAQAVQAILPEIVVPAPIDDKYLTVRYEKLIPLLIEAIKEQNNTIEELKDRVLKLERT